MKYPVDLVPQSLITDEYVKADGTKAKVVDTFRYLEDPESVQTKNWIEAQRKLTDLYLSTCDIREKFKDKIADKWAFDEVSVPYKIGDTFYFDFSAADEDNIKIYRFKKPNYYNFE